MLRLACKSAGYARCASRRKRKYRRSQICRRQKDDIRALYLHEALAGKPMLFGWDRRAMREMLTFFVFLKQKKYDDTNGKIGNIRQRLI